MMPFLDIIKSIVQSIDIIFMLKFKLMFKLMLLDVTMMFPPGRVTLHDSKLRRLSASARAWMARVRLRSLPKVPLQRAPTPLDDEE